MGPGLSDAECRRVEHLFGFDFADDHRAFLGAGLPTGRGWPDWRSGTRQELEHRLAWPVDGVLFDVEHNGYWDEAWPIRPTVMGEALTVARTCLSSVPQMVPVFGHRFLPAGRGLSGHPVLSIYQTDIIYYGSDLVDYVDHEFGSGGGRWGDGRSEPHATVAFWQDFLE